MVEIKPLVDPDYDAIGRQSELIQKAINLLEKGKTEEAKGELYYLKGVTSAVEKYFDLNIKAEYNINK